MVAAVRLTLALALLAASAHGAEIPRFTLKTNVKGAWLEGTPLAWSDDNVRLLCRDGALRSFAPGDARDAVKVSETFRAYSQGEMRAALQREFGNKFDVSGTGHYLVVHPAGQHNAWAGRFEELYRSFAHYFAVRGFRVLEPEFPLVAIVVPKQDEMLAYAAREGNSLSRSVLGYYSSESNRVILYDQTGGKADSKNWADNNDTIIHEATHQTAFNTGIHPRHPGPPVWVAEGLGTLFEAPGVWNSRANPHRPSRINKGRLGNYRDIAAKLNGDAIADIVASDRLFRQNPGAAYAIAWATTFYLIETQPKKYGDYLKRTARHGEKDPTAQVRLADFTAEFGADFKMFHARFARFMTEL